jgi:hypothetical protein
VKVNHREEGMADATIRKLLIIIPGIFALGVFIYITAQIPHAMEDSRKATCQSNISGLAFALYMYAKDYDGYLPPPERWIDALGPEHLGSHHILTCVNVGRTPAFALNSALKGMRLKDIKNPSKVVLVFECRPGANMHGGMEILPEKPRHMGGDNIAFADEHVEWVKRSDAGTLKWTAESAAK